VIPAVRAVADRFIIDTANVKYIVEYLPKGGEKRPVPNSAWTVGQTIGHLAMAHALYAAIIERLVAGDSRLPPGFDPDRTNAEEAKSTLKWRSKRLIAELDASLKVLLVAFEKMDASHWETRINGRFPVSDFLSGGAQHIAIHGLDVADALPELRFDPIVINWLLYVDFSASPELFERQQKLFADARKYFREHGEDDEDIDLDEEVP
jgi:hypothetical protein